MPTIDTCVFFGVPSVVVCGLSSLEACSWGASASLALCSASSGLLRGAMGLAGARSLQRAAGGWGAGSGGQSVGLGALGPLGGGWKMEKPTEDGETEQFTAGV